MTEEIEKRHWQGSKLIDNCAKCGRHGPIWSNTSGEDLCKGCAVDTKATDAGMDALRGD